MKSLRWRITLWFTLSLLVVLAVFVGLTYLHLLHELRVEKWERGLPGHETWTLHGNYSDGEVADIAGELLHLSLIYAVPVILLTLALGFYLAKRAFAPVQLLNRQLQAIGPRRLDQRVDVPHADDEFRDIERNINALLDRLDTRFRQLTEFSAQVAHELRTPLTLLRLQVEDAADRIEPALAESLQDEMRRLSDYVDQCLLLATAEQGRLSLELQPVDLAVLVREMIDVYELLAREQDRDIELNVEETAPAIQADPRRLRQMLHNLLTNALRHGAGPIHIHIGQTADHPRCEIRNAVRSTSPAPTGSADSPQLGLRIVHALAALHPGLTFTTTTSDRPTSETFTATLQWR
ncbi:histidine kinase dimerization/phospho-acceptor domain-containing protein [Actomonas aquatica]|uniref:histidine kinase n=1 Tax=Actomonas aquatica TaxID=2866162 RepID=A0ABZ1C443_9BACT|nr:histidine kinase dimerization/phospho-acceptor domain-containing protein [Opitutus sp. WL0086]WRQ86221.1 histidine kinase dimerization/phospho-acceptor domain-containing protein [Opitutus sp. WL0086]